jgi:uncharacterized protein YoaH (UPF0181 family)
MASLKLAHNHKHATNAVEKLDEIGAEGIRTPEGLRGNGRHLTVSPLA